MTTRMPPPLLFALIAMVACSGWVSTTTASAAATTISGEVKAGDGGMLNGIVLIEKGRLYGKDFRYGGRLIDGRFSVEVDGGGDHGLHIYATGYIYFPLGLKVKQDTDNRGTYSLPPNPAAAHSPVISDVRFKQQENSTIVSFLVTDPDGDLSHQVLAYNQATGEAFRLSPSSFVLPFARKYPNGLYTLNLGDQAAKPGDWYFIAADNKCYNSPVLGHPFDETGIVPATPAKTGIAEIHDPTVPAGGSSAESGATVFSNNCGMCHHRDSGKTKVGPGLKGLYGMEFTPAQKLPVTDGTIRKQIVGGGKEMPPYSHLSDREVDAVVEYLKTL